MVVHDLTCSLVAVLSLKLKPLVRKRNAKPGMSGDNAYRAGDWTIVSSTTCSVEVHTIWGFALDL